MPYFFICPIYVLLLFGLLALAMAARFVPRFRFYSSHIAFGAIGTLPGFLIGNAVFWIAVVGLAIVLKKPLDGVDGVFKSGVAVTFALAFFVGLAAVNVGGCVVGFLSGWWLRNKIQKKPNKSLQPTPVDRGG